MRLYDQVLSDDAMMMVLMIVMLWCPHHELLLAPVFCPAVSISAADEPSVSPSQSRRVATTAFTFKTLLRHFAIQAFTLR